MLGVVGLAGHRRGRRPELGHGRVEGVLLPSGDDDGAALVDESLGDRVADSPAAARDERDPVRESVHSCLLDASQASPRRLRGAYRPVGTTQLVAHPLGNWA